jgi:hypothetical protein
MLAFEKAALAAIFALALVAITAVAMTQEPAPECVKHAGIAIYGDCRR